MRQLYLKTNLEHAGAIERTSVIISIVCGEWTVVGTVPWIIQRITGISFVAINLKFIVVGFRVNFKVRILGISEGYKKSFVKQF